MRGLIFIISFITAISFSSCSEDLVGPMPSGAYSYKSYDSTGTAIVQGWLTIDFEDSTKISGNWYFEKIGNPQRIGPQVGGGELVGGLRDGIIEIGLNPQFKDSNVFLSGTMDSGKYRGKWIYASFPGLTNYGTFEAMKN